MVVSCLSAIKDPRLSAEPLRSRVASSRAEKLFFLLLGESCRNIACDRFAAVQLSIYNTEKRPTVKMYSWQVLINKLLSTTLQPVLVLGMYIRVTLYAHLGNRL